MANIRTTYDIITGQNDHIARHAGPSTSLKASQSLPISSFPDYSVSTKREIINSSNGVTPVSHRVASMSNDARIAGTSTSALFSSFPVSSVSTKREIINSSNGVTPVSHIPFCRKSDAECSHFARGVCRFRHGAVSVAPRASNLRSLTPDEYRSYTGTPEGQNKPAITIVALVPREISKKIVGEDGFHSIVTEIVFEKNTMTLCADSLKWTEFAASNKSREGLCSGPKQCGHKHFPKNKGSLCGYALAGIACTHTDCKYIHTLEFPRVAGGAGRVTGAGRVAGAIAMGRRHYFPTLHCKGYLAKQYGISAPECTGCGFAHETLAETETIKEFNRRIATGTLDVQKMLIAVWTALSSVTKFENSELYNLVHHSGFPLPSFERKNASAIFTAWMFAASKGRRVDRESGTCIDPNAFSLFGVADNEEENMVWELCRRFKTCTASTYMHQYKTFGHSEKQLILAPAVGVTISSEQCIICQGGVNCKHGVHFGGSTLAIDIDNFNGKSSRLPVNTTKMFARLAEIKVERISLRSRLTGRDRKVVEETLTALNKEEKSLMSEYYARPVTMQLFDSETTATALDTRLSRTGETTITGVFDEADYDFALPVPVDETEEQKSVREAADVARIERLRIKREREEAERLVMATRNASEMLAIQYGDYDALRPYLFPRLFVEVSIEAEPEKIYSLGLHTALAIDGKRNVFVTSSGKKFVIAPPAPGKHLFDHFSAIDNEWIDMQLDVYHSMAFDEELVNEFMKTGANSYISFWDFKSVREMWSKYKSHNVKLSWSRFVDTVSVKRDTWTNLGLVRRTFTEWVKGEGKVVREHIEEDPNCWEKREYLDFWSFYFEIPKHDIRSGLIGESWASTLAQSESALFDRFLSERTPSETFVAWILKDEVRSATKTLWETNQNSSWSTLVKYTTVVTRRTTTISLETFLENSALTLKYCNSRASQNVGAPNAGITLAQFLEFPEEYIEFYARVTDKSFDDFIADKKEGWMTVPFRKVEHLNLAALSHAKPDAFKALIKALSNTFSTGNDILSTVYNSGELPYGLVLPFFFGDKKYTVRASIWDHILFQLIVAVSAIKPNKEVIKSLLSQLPSDDGTAESILSAACDKLSADHKSTIASKEQEIEVIRASRSSNKEKKARISKLQSELEIIRSKDIDAMVSLVKSTTTSITVVDEYTDSPLIEFAQTILDSDEAVPVLVTKSKIAKKSKTGSTTKITSNVVDEEDDIGADPFAQPKRPAHKLNGRFDLSGRDFYLVDHKFKEDSKSSQRLVLGPFETKTEASRVKSFLKKSHEVNPSAIVQETYESIHEVHIVMRAANGWENCKELLSNEHDERLQLFKLIATHLNTPLNKFLAPGLVICEISPSQNFFRSDSDSDSDSSDSDSESDDEILIGGPTDELSAPKPVHDNGKSRRNGQEKPNLFDKKVRGGQGTKGGNNRDL